MTPLPPHTSPLFLSFSFSIVTQRGFEKKEEEEEEDEFCVHIKLCERRTCAGACVIRESLQVAGIRSGVCA